MMANHILVLMAQEHESQVARLTAIHVDLVGRSITFEAGREAATKLTLTPEGITYELIAASGPAITERSVERLQGAAEGKEREPIATLTGRLKTQPKEGRADRNGKPTSWAKFAVHEEGRDDARMYSTTFHRHTAAIALGLPRDALVTLQGYVRESKNPQRMDSLSVFNLLAYPGKPGKAAGE